MKSRKLSFFAVSVGMTVSLFSLALSQAHAAASDADGANTTTSKQELKAQQKADRKARRAQKNAELSTLEKNGYKPTRNQTDYPQNIQDAQRKAAEQKPTNAPAAAP